MYEWFSMGISLRKSVENTLNEAILGQMNYFIIIFSLKDRENKVPCFIMAKKSLRTEKLR